MDFNKGEVYANEFQKGTTVIGKFFTLEDAPDNTFSYLLSQTNYSVLFLDFQSIKNQKLNNYLKHTKVKYRNVTAIFDYEYPLDMRFRNHTLAERFDALIVVNESNPITLLSK